jgi:SAM-dependent methyltransferase
MHLEATDFLNFVKQILPQYFVDKKVLDVGAGDINGNNRYLFTNCEYNSNDVIESDNVTIVSLTKDLPFNNEYFDTIISSECFEHDSTYEDSLNKIYTMLKPGGLFAFTCAGYGRQEHGTRRTTPYDSYGTIANIETMQDYYKNLTIFDVDNCLKLNENFVWDSYYNKSSKDLYFVGIKKINKNNKKNYNLKKYIKENILNTKNLIK